MTDPRLDALARADAGRLKAAAEALLPWLGDVKVLRSHTGLIMAPMRDTVEGVAFHLGEVLVSEAHVRLGRAEGYGLRRGRDLEAAMAMALLDLALTTGRGADAAAAFCDAEARAQAQADRETLRRVEATRVAMETF